MTRHIITALVPEPLRSELAVLRRRYDTFTRQWLPSHVTIIPPFEQFLTRDERAFIRSYTCNVPVALSEWGAYPRQYNTVLFLKVADHAFDDVRADIVKTIPKLQPFVPTDPRYHVTVVNRIPNDKFEALSVEVKKHSVSASFTIDHLDLFEWDDEVRRWISVTM